MQFLPLNDAAIAAPECCEMCGQQLKEPDTRTTHHAGLGELLRHLSAMYFDARHAVPFVLIRIACPTWSYDQIAGQIGISRAEVGRLALDIARHYPVISEALNVYAARPCAQAARREAEVDGADTRTMCDGTTWRTNTWQRTKARLTLATSREQ